MRTPVPSGEPKRPWRVGILACLMLALCAARGARAEEPVRYMLHGGSSHEPPTEEYLRFVEQVRPQVLIAGVFDARLYAQALPAPGRKGAAPEELLRRWGEVARRLRRSGIRLVGQMQINVVSDDPADRERGTGWVGYYDRAWNEKLLGPRPTRTFAELLEEPDLAGDARPDGKVPQGDTVARCGCRVNTRALVACINKPAWREVHRRLVRAAVDAGVEGFITNRNYFGHCGCEHCRARLRRWLGERHDAPTLRAALGIADLGKHPLTCLVGAHREIDTAPDPLVLEQLRLSKHQVKDFFDEVYVRYGRQLRKDLFVAQWNHMAYFDELHLDRGHLPPAERTTVAHATADERWGLPPGLWGKDESLIWYCNWGTTQNTILAKEYAGDTALYGKYVRAMAGGRPYVINKYDFYRPRNMMAEAAALGYATNPIATPWQSEQDREVVLRYFAFLKQHEGLYRQAEPLGEVGLLFPRRAVHAGDASPLEYVEAAGRALLREHVQFDFLPDDRLAELPLAGYRVLVASAIEYLDRAGRAALGRYVAGGGKLVLLPVDEADRRRPSAAVPAARRPRPEDLRRGATVVAAARTDRAAVLKAIWQAAGGPEQLSRFEAPWTVAAHCYRQPAQGRLVVHLVNYNHREKAAGRTVVEREAPIPADPVGVRLRLPAGFRAGKVRFLAPDGDGEQGVSFRQRGGVLECRTPGFLMYGMMVVEGGEGD